jgi:hypothetical protein
VYTYEFAAGPYDNDPLLDLDIRGATDGSRHMAGRGSDARALANVLCDSQDLDSLSMCDVATTVRCL